MNNVLFLTGKLNNRKEPLRLGKLTGDEDLKLTTLVQAVNLDIDVNGFTRLRDGRTLRAAGSLHSFWSHPKQKDIAYCIESPGELRKVETDYSLTPVATLASDARTFFQRINDEIALTNGVDIGWISGTTYDPFDSILGQFERMMPAGQYMCLHRGCLHVAVGDILYVSKPQMPEVRDERYSMFPMGGYIRMLGSVNTGLWIGTDKGIGFITGKSIDEYEYNQLTDNPCPDGAFLATTQDEGDDVKNVVAWVSEEGFCQGKESGTYENHSHPDVALPKGESGLLYERFNNGIRQYVAVIHTPESERKHTDADLSVNTVYI